jgi:hypothetical protein
VLLPHRLVLAFRGSVLVKAAREATVAVADEAMEAATDWIEHFVEDNRTPLNDLSRWYTAACLALGAEIVLWVLGAPGALE